MKETLPSQPDPQDDILKAAEELSTLQQDSEYHPAEEEAIKRAKEILADSPAQTVEAQSERIGRHAVAEGRINFADLKAKLEEPEEDSETIDSTTVEVEAKKERSKSTLRNIGRVAAFPFRKSIELTKNGTKKFFETGNRKFDEFLKAGEKKFTPQPKTDTLEDTPADTVDTDDINPTETLTNDEQNDVAPLNKRSARGIDKMGDLIDSDKEDSLRYKVATKLYDYAEKVDERKGNYGSRATERVRNRVDQFDEWTRANDGWLTEKIKQKAAEARENRANRIKKLRLRNLGKKVIAYHQGGRQAAKEVSKNIPENNELEVKA